jgi:hypothetical protein
MKSCSRRFRAEAFLTAGAVLAGPDLGLSCTTALAIHLRCVVHRAAGRAHESERFIVIGFGHSTACGISVGL